MTKCRIYIILLSLFLIEQLNAQILKDWDWGDETAVYDDGKLQVYISFYRSISSCEPGGKQNRYRFRLTGILKSGISKTVPVRFSYLNCEGRQIPVVKNIDVGDGAGLGNREKFDYNFTGDKLISIDNKPVKDSTNTNTADNVIETQMQSGNPGKLTLKVIANTDCEIFIDGETQGSVRAGDIEKLLLNKGSYKLTAKPLKAGFGLFDTIYPVKETELNSELVFNVRIPVSYGIKPGDKNLNGGAVYQDDLPAMILVHGGSFNMGSGDGGFNERPVHKVSISDFSIGKYEITVRQFRAFIQATKYVTTAEKTGTSFVWNGKTGVMQKGANWMCDASGAIRTTEQDDEPVIHVSWDDVVNYCRWLSKKTGKDYRLLTEAEWEYSCRGGNRSMGYKYSGSSRLDNVAWFRKNSLGQTRPVGQRQPNEIGIFDMSGNVWEWCADNYDAQYYTGSPANDPKGPALGQEKVFRGGAWDNADNYFPSSLRNKGFSTYRSYNLGFRVACN